MVFVLEGKNPVVLLINASADYSYLGKVCANMNASRRK